MHLFRKIISIDKIKLNLINTNWFSLFVANGIESMTTNGNIDPFDGNKSRKSSGFSDGTNGGGSKSRQYSGYELQNKSRNCSGNSISAGLVSSGRIT